jgi:BAHD acyltransferase
LKVVFLIVEIGLQHVHTMESESSILELSRLDQTVLRVYVRQLLIFPFPDPNLRKDAQIVLAAGLLATLRQFPFLAGTVEVADPETGLLKVQYPNNVDEESVRQILTTNELDLEILDYETLREAGFPPSSLPADTLCPTILISHPGIDDQYAEVLTTFSKGQPIPIFASQLNSIRGGLILSAYIHHSVVDGTGIAKIYQVWSNNTRNFHAGSSLPDQANPSSLNRARHALDTLADGATAMELPEFRNPNAPPTAPLRTSPYPLSAKLLIFSYQKISSLATSLTHMTKTRISPFTAICALVWTHVTRARRAALLAAGIETTALGIAIDHRKRVGALLPDDYLGNCANGMIVRLPLASIPATGKMAIENAALALSGALGEVDLDWFCARLLELSKREVSTKWILNLDTQNGPDIFITSWQHIGADEEWGIPGTMRAGEGEGEGWACKPAAIRKPHNLWEGGMQILPRKRGEEAPFEIPLCLEEGEMGRVLEGLEEEKWVERVVEA